jgi:3-hydroxyacyl-CoA dehydrogenase/enoyl-CoA hydratase/3-hydroxybutyryl-CoA epimerase
MKDYKHWRLEKDAEQILWLFFDKKDSSVNTIDHEVMRELSEIVNTLASTKDYKAVVIASAKKNGFIAGADITQFSQFKESDEAVDLLRQGQQIFDKIENLPQITVALIDGFCLGGGLELALACRYRVAEDSSKTRLGLPEVKLGIHPGWGGTVRLPRLISAPQALNMILSGHTVSGKAAAKLGFVDAAVPKRHLVTAAKYYALHSVEPRKKNLVNQLLKYKIPRTLLATYLRKKLREKISPEHYPAPFQVIDNWEEVGVLGDAPLKKEAETCGKLFLSETSQNLVRVFFLQERLKSLAKESQFSPQRVHVVGAGTMGGDIAAWCALQGMHVTLQDREAKLIAPAIKRAYQLFKEKLKEPHLIQKAMDRLVPDVTGLGASHADVLIEAIFENLEAKQALFRLLEKQAKPQAILATNTSSIPLDEINSVMEKPERLVGIHFFNPVPKMLLVEIVAGDHTATDMIQNAIAFTRKIDRLPLLVKSSPGFLVNRILMPYLLESVKMLDEGIPASVIDKAMVDFGMPMGPVALADAVGLDVCLSVANYLGKYLNVTVPTKLAALVEQRKCGRKTGEGFYRYTKAGKLIHPAKDEPYTKSLKEISDRLVSRLLDESFACLHAGVVSDADLLDAGMIFGTGFAPFRGGPMNYAKKIAPEKVD